MGQRKTLGGDRVGSGSKMKVDTKTFNRSTHDIGYVWRSTMSVGTLVPFMCKVVLPADSIDLNLGCEVLTLPTVGPLFGSMKVQLDTYLCPVRLYQGQLHNNKLGIGMNMANVKLPILKMTAPQLLQSTNVNELDNWQINPSSILSYLGIRGIGIASSSSADERQRDFNAIPLLAYWDIYKNYYANKQEEFGFVIHNPVNPVVQNTTDIGDGTDSLGQNGLVTGMILLVQGKEIQVTTTATQPATDLYIQLAANPSGIFPSGTTQWYPLTELFDIIVQTPTQIRLVYKFGVWGNQVAISWRYRNENDSVVREVQVQQFQLSDIDVMREKILEHAVNSTPFDVFAQMLQPYSYLVEEDGTQRSIVGSQEGLGLKTYQSDLFNNWLDSELIDGVNGIAAVTAISTVGDEFTIDSLILHKKVYDMLNDILVSGGTYNDWSEVVYDHPYIARAESPIYYGSLIKELQFQEVISNAESPAVNGAPQPLGTIAGRGRLGNKHKGGNMTIRVDEISYLIGIVSITPRLDYSQGNEWDVNLKTMDDFHKPHMDEIGFQELITDQMAWWDTRINAGEVVFKSAGKQPAWINYMTDTNKVKGNFAVANNSMFMVLTRRYEAEFEDLGFNIKDLTTYIDPVKFNHIFAQTSLDSQNFWVQIGVDMKARRKISARIMPNL